MTDDFREHLRRTMAQEMPTIKRLAYEYLVATADLAKDERLDFARRKEFFRPHFAHLTGITQAMIISQCCLRVTDRYYSELRKAEASNG
jgi:hypothetical protein